MWEGTAIWRTKGSKGGVSSVEAFRSNVTTGVMGADIAIVLAVKITAKKTETTFRQYPFA